MILRLMYISILVLSACILRAQSAREEYETRRDVFLGNNIYVVYTGKAALDSSLYESFSKFWTIRPIKGFVSKKELKNLIGDKNNSFFYITPSCHNSGFKNYEICVTCIFAFNGGRKNTGKYNFLYDAAATEYFDDVLYESDPEKSGYRMPLMVSRLEQEINLKYDSSAGPKFNKKKILAVNNDLVNGRKSQRCIDMEALAVWPGKYELLTPDKIAQLVRNRDERYMLITPILSRGTSYVTLHDLASMRPIGTMLNKKTVFRTPWVRSNEIESLLETVNGNQKKK